MTSISSALRHLIPAHERDVAYHTKKWDAEKKRAAERPAWVRALREGLS